MNYGPQPISYADMAIGAIFFNLPAAFPDEVRDILSAAQNRHTSEKARMEYVERVLRYVENFHRTLLVHEWCHILQAISYPALYMRCCRELHFVTRTLSELRKIDQEMPLQLRPSEEWKTTIDMPVLFYRILIDENGKVKLTQGDSSFPLETDLTESHLLEEDASVFQYKVEIGSEGTGSSYRQWLKERSRYTMVFRYLRSILGEENAYVALQPLVRTAFSTTWPMPTFANLLGWTIRNGKSFPTDLGTESYFLFLQNSVKESATFKRDVPSVYDPATKDQLSYLGDSEFRSVIEGTEYHPLHLLAKTLHDKGTSSKESTDLLSSPYRAFPRDQHNVSDEIMEYFPPLTFFRIIDPRVSTGESLSMVAPRFAGKRLPFLQEMTYHEYLIEMMNEKHLVWSMLTNYLDSDPHNCYHTTCPFYPANLCRRWPKIPRSFDDCEFPEWFARVTGHNLDPKAEKLRRVGIRKG